MRLAFPINAHQNANQKPIGSAPSYRAQCTLPPRPMCQTLLFNFSRVWFRDYITRACTQSHNISHTHLIFRRPRASHASPCPLPPDHSAASASLPSSQCTISGHQPPKFSMHNHRSQPPNAYSDSPQLPMHNRAVSSMPPSLVSPHAQSHISNLPHPQTYTISCWAHSFHPTMVHMHQKAVTNLLRFTSTQSYSPQPPTLCLTSACTIRKLRGSNSKLQLYSAVSTVWLLAYLEFLLCSHQPRSHAYMQSLCSPQPPNAQSTAS